jgi:hypothetical protein
MNLARFPEGVPCVALDQVPPPVGRPTGRNRRVPMSAFKSLFLWRRRGVGMRLVGPRVEEGGALDESRRDLIKKGAVGAGLVWASPMVQSVTSPAFGQVGTPGPTTTVPRLACTDPSGCADPRYCGTETTCVCVSTTDGDNACIDQSSLSDLCSSPGPGRECPPGFECFCPDGVCAPGVCVRFCSSSADCGSGAVCATNLLCRDPRSICFPLGSSELCSGAAQRAGASSWEKAFGRGR